MLINEEAVIGKFFTEFVMKSKLNEPLTNQFKLIDNKKLKNRR